MGRWLERYTQGRGSEVWTEMTSSGVDLRSDEAAFADARAVARETMKRARANVELLVELLPAIGYRFEGEPFVGAAPDVAGELDALEAGIGLLPLALRAWSLWIPNPGADGLLLWEPHQTTFVNYLRQAFRAAGLPGWYRRPGDLPDWALPSEPPPPELAEIARRLAPL